MRTIITLVVGFWLPRTLYRNPESLQKREAAIQRRLRKTLDQQGWSKTKINEVIRQVMPSNQ